MASTWRSQKILDLKSPVKLAVNYTERMSVLKKLKTTKENERNKKITSRIHSVIEVGK